MIARLDFNKLVTIIFTCQKPVNVQNFLSPFFFFVQEFHFIRSTICRTSDFNSGIRSNYMTETADPVVCQKLEHITKRGFSYCICCFIPMKSYTLGQLVQSISHTIVMKSTPVVPYTAKHGFLWWSIHPWCQINPHLPSGQWKARKEQNPASHNGV